jgi:uncharacterized membrane protein
VFIRLAELHPIMVHFPIALLITSVALDLVSVVFRRWRLTEAASWCLALGVPFAAAALLSGKISAGSVNAAAAGNLLHLHKTFAVAASVAFGSLLVVRLIWLAPRILGWMGQARWALAQPVVRVDERLRQVLPAMYAPAPRLAIAAYLLASLVSVFLLAVTGYLGGAMVYHHGVGMP